MNNRLSRLVLGAGFFLLCAAFFSALHGQQATADSAAAQEARNQVGEIVHAQVPSALPGPYRTMADMKRAMQTYEAVFAAYSHVPLLNPPRGFKVVHNYNADARETPRGLPIPVGGALILLAYDSNKRLPNGRFADEGEGPVLGSITINRIDCANPADPGLGEDDKSKFYFAPKQSGTMQGWPKYDSAFGSTVFLTRRTQPQWLPVTVERMLNVQLAKAQQQMKDTKAADSIRPQNAYAEWMKGHDERIRQYQETHDQLAKTNKQLADQMLANALKSEEETAKVMQAVAEKGGGINQQVDEAQSKSAKSLQDLQNHLNSLSPQQRSAPAYVYEAPDGAHSVGEVVPAGTPGAQAVVYPNPDFYDRTVSPWEAQSICVSEGAGPRTQESGLYPTILNIWNSLDWDGIAKVLK